MELTKRREDMTFEEVMVLFRNQPKGKLEAKFGVFDKKLQEMSDEQFGEKND